jgi:hypothetical protein
VKPKHTSNRRPSPEMETSLNQSKNVHTRAAQRACTGHGIAPDTAVALIAGGKITREMSCDGKKRFRTYEFAEETVRPSLEAKYGKRYTVYACAFCSGFHCATEKELVA